MNMMELIQDRYPDQEFLRLDPGDQFDRAIVGVADGRLVYSVSKIIKALMAKPSKMTRMEAVEWYEYNINGAYLGELTPIYVEDDF